MADDKETESAQPPSKLPRLSGGTDDPDARTVAMATSSPLVLGLGLGLGGDSNSGDRDTEASAMASKVRSVLTFMQHQELEHQVLIYRYFAAGAPVPVHLVLPIWKSVAASSFGPQRFPSLMGLGSLCFDYRSSMEPEPGRCRRTDGKKWRCSREAFGDSKYCEKHIHRGKNRSRKPVEPITTSPATTLAISPPAQPNYGQRLRTAYHQQAPPPPLQLHLDAAGSYHRQAPSPPPSYHRYAASLFPGGGYGAASTAREIQEAELRRQRCLALGADLSLDKPAPTATEKPLRRFFDDWAGGGMDDATQLSISMPSASPADLAAGSRYHHGE